MLFTFHPILSKFTLRFVLVAVLLNVSCMKSDKYDYLGSLDSHARTFTVELFDNNVVTSLTIGNPDNRSIYVYSEADTSNLIPVPDESVFRFRDSGIELIANDKVVSFSSEIAFVGENGKKLLDYLSYSSTETTEITLRGSPEIKRAQDGITATVTAYEHDIIASMMVNDVKITDPIAYKQTMAILFQTTLYAAASGNNNLSIREAERTGIQFGSEIPDQFLYTIIEETSDYIALYNDLPVPMYTTEMCGGMTATPDMVWQDLSAEPQNQVVICQDCIEKGSYEWSNTVSTDMIGEALFGYPGYVDIWISKFYENGRPQHITAQWEENKKTFTIEEFRKRISAQVNDKKIILSDWFEIEADPEDSDRKSGPFQILNIKKPVSTNHVHFIGWGRGHGVGLCQHSARQQADAGKNFVEILDHFYPRLETGRIQREQ